MSVNTCQTGAGDGKSVKRTTSVELGLVALLFIGVAFVIAGMSAPRTSAAGVIASRTVNVTDSANMHRTSEVGATIVEEGQATGALPGHVKAKFKIGTTVSATAVLSVGGGGTISIRGLGVLHSSGVSASFSGTMSATGGTGRYAHAHGSGGFYGVVNRRSWTVKMQITGHLAY